MTGRRRAVTLGATAASAAAGTALMVGGAFGATISTAAFSGGAGTVLAGGQLYARQGATVTLAVTTSSNTRCVSVGGAHTDVKTSATPKSSWSFSFTAPAGDGVRSVNVTAGEDFNGNNVCTKQTATTSTSYIADNSGPSVKAAVTPTPNNAGWNNADASIAWSATDAGSGVASGPTPAADSVTANTAGATKTATAIDRLGNSATGSVTVKLDKTAPTFNFSRSPEPNANGWNNTDVTLSFNCADSLSGIRTCTGGGTQVLSDEGTNIQVTGLAVDNADNSASNPVTGVNIDKTAPTLTGAATTAPNADGWYSDDVKVHWTASDSLSGLDAGAPADSTVAGEGSDLSTTQTVADKAGNVMSRTVSGIKIDRTPPTTVPTAATGWSASNATVDLAASDSLSGVKTTRYQVDGGTTQTGTHPSITGDGTHTVEFWSTDAAGNTEAHKSIQVKIDATAPSISHLLSQAPNANGWHNADVSIEYTCDDDTSGVASCGPDTTVTEEGKSQDIVGTAVDNAGNTATDHVLISLDKTKPTISAAADRGPDANGWYRADVKVSFTCGDALSGVDNCPATRTLGEGADQSASATVTDAAGNEAGAGVAGLDVDETAPALSGAATTAPNDSGWYHGDVTVHWTASDELSGLDGPAPEDSVVQGEGSNLSAGATVHDKAGNSTTRTVDGIKIDRSAPVTTAKVAAPLDSGWYAGDVDVTLSADDSLSGVEATYYSVDGGDATPYTGRFAFGTKGIHTIRFWSADKAGNVEDHGDDAHALVLKIDGIAPTIEGSRNPLANGFGWSNTPVTVTFDCDDAESGIAGCDAPVTLTNEGAGQSVTGNAVDNAGNKAHATVDKIDIDLTKPTLKGLTTPDANAAGWYRGDVTIHWDGQDGLSGIDPATQPADSTITGEGDDLGAGPVTIADKAGNVSDPASVSGIRVDRHAPVITGKPTTAPNAAGWYSGEVVVDFSCSDNLSGVASCPTSAMLKSDGANQSVTSGAATDFAGNVASGISVGGIKIDSQPPTTTADNQCTKTNGYCTGSTANVVLTATDQTALAGVKEIHYRIDGGAEQVSAGESKTVSVPLDGSGAGTVTYWAVDNAGNVETPNSASLKWDNIAPTVTHTLNPVPNSTGWNVDDVTVHFNAKDDDNGSGVDPSTLTPDALVHDETNGLVIDGSAKDTAGNLGKDSVTVKLDRTPPAVSGTIVSGTKGANGWYTGPVRVAFTCSDALSGMAICPDPVTLTQNGANQSVSGTATDAAGNKATATVTGIDIDQNGPDITVSGVKDGAQYTLGEAPKDGACTASDGLSGVGSCNVTVSGGQPNGVGTFTYVAKATDKAGNTTQVTGTFRVVYRFDGFLQPVNDTAHQIGSSTSSFKAGSTVPAKLQLKKADGTVVQVNAAPAWLAPAKGSATTAPVDESVYGDTPETGTTFRYDAAAQQYIYNWGTAKTQAGSYWRMGVKLDDGQTYYVNIGLK